MTGRLLFDVTGLVHWYGYFDTPSGVQRVTQKVIASNAVAHHSRAECVARVLGSRRFFRVPIEIIADLSCSTRHRRALMKLRSLFAASMTLCSLRELRREARFVHVPYIAYGLVRSQDAELIALPDNGDAIVNLGDFWTEPGLADALIDLRAVSGATYIHLLHDLIPLARPDWTIPFFARVFVRQLARLAPMVDHWLTPSRFVRNSLRDYIAERCIDPKPTSIVPLGWNSLDDGERRPHEPRASDAAVLAGFGLAGRPYLLHVGTVEARKNLLALIDAVAQLRRDHGDLVPHLVLAGKAGWQSEVVRHRLSTADVGRGTVTWISKARDQDLGALYRGARFVVLPSRFEGWGLPVRESLGHGTPCIISRGGALPEAGGALAHYFQSSEVDGICATLAEWILNDSAVAIARRVLVRYLEEGVPFPSWDDAGAHVVQVARDTLATRRDERQLALSA